MASTVDSYICLKKAIRNAILFQTEIQVYWVFGPVFCRSQCAACANNFSFERLGHGPSSFSRKTYKNEEGINGLLAVNNIHPLDLILYVYPLLTINFTSPCFEPYYL